MTGIGIMIAGSGYAYSSWNSGKNKYKDEIISDLKVTLGLKESEITRLNEDRTLLITSHQIQITDLQKELSELKGAFTEQSKKLEEYKHILENRDPQFVTMLREISAGIKSLNAHSVVDEKQRTIVAQKLAKDKGV